LNFLIYTFLKKQKYVVDYSRNFTHSMAFGIYYFSYFWRVDSHSADNSGRGNCHTTTSGQADVVDYTLPNFVSMICLTKKRGFVMTI
jgi:hypothetical protein